MSTALDYSAGVPSAAVVARSGYSAVIRYVKKRDPSSVHVLTSAEVDDMTAHGIAVAVVYEAAAASRMLDGGAAGIQDAHWADQQTRAVGITPRCIYFTCDFDAQPAQYPAVAAYLDGAASVIGIEQVGLYGGYNVIVNCGSHATYHWQTMAWSGGRVAPGIHIRQRIGQVTVDGVTCDINDLFADDYGQHPAPVIAPASPDPAQLAEDDSMYVIKPTTPGTYLLISGAGVCVINDHATTGALQQAGIKFIQFSDADFARVRALAKQS